MAEFETDALVLANENEKLTGQISTLTVERDSLKKSVESLTAELKTAKDSVTARDNAEAASLRASLAELAGDGYKEEEIKSMSLDSLRSAVDALKRTIPKAGTPVDMAVRQVGGSDSTRKLGGDSRQMTVGGEHGFGWVDKRMN